MRVKQDYSKNNEQKLNKIFAIPIFKQNKLKLP